MNRAFSTAFRAGAVASIFATLLACASADEPPPAARPSLEESVLRVGLTQIAFSNLTQPDAVAAYRAFIIAIGRKRGYEVQPDVQIFDTVPPLTAAVRRGTINLAVMGTWQLLQSGLNDEVEIAFVPAASDVVSRRQLLLVRRDGHHRTLADLRGGEVLILRDTRTTLGRPWLETLCLEAGFGLPHQFFGAVKIAERGHTAVLPVFFGRADACVVDEQTFAVACELNPQLQRALIAIAQSDPMVDSVLCLNHRGWASARRRDDLRQGLGELHTVPSGQQLLTVFKLDRLVPFTPTLLGSARGLYARRLAFARDFPLDADAPPAVVPTP